MAHPLPKAQKVGHPRFYLTIKYGFLYSDASYRHRGTKREPPDLAYNYTAGHNNGNIAYIQNNVNTARNQSYTYDSLNRLFTAETTVTSPNGSCWGEQYTYDPWGNLSAISSPSSAYTGCSQESLSMTPTVKNQLQDTANDFVYDAAGNLTQPGASSGTYVYDAENHLISAGGVNYTYDGDGNRVMKSNGTIYWYGANDAALKETDLSGNFLRGYFFFNGQRVARSLPTNEVGFYLTDHLGSVRYLGGSATGYSIDYFPFGGIILYSDTGDDRYQFTSKERDAESNLDNFGARFYGSSLGRFMTPDPDNLGSFAGAPQSWNAYSYVLNNPLNAVDPSGLDCVYANSDDSVTVKTGDCYSENDEGIFVDGTVNLSTISATHADDGTINGLSFTYSPTAGGDPILRVESNPDTSRERFLCQGGDAICNTTGVIRIIGNAQSAGTANFAIGSLFKLAFDASISLLAPRAAPEVPASTPVGRQGRPMNVTPGTNSPTKIGGRYYTGHALDRMQGRGFTPSVVEDTIKTGVESPGTEPDTLKYSSGQATVVTNRAGDVVTVW